MKSGLPLRAYLIGIVLAVALPLAVLISYDIYSGAADIERHEGAAVVRIAEHAAQDVARFVAENRRALEAVARQHQARLLGAAHCKTVMAILVLAGPLYANLTVRDRDDKPVCAAADRPLPLTSPEPESFEQAVRENRFVMGRAYVAPQIKRWVMQFRQPIRDDQGQVIGIISAPIDLARFNFAPARPRDPAHSVTRVVEGSGTVIASSEDAESLVGRTVRGTPIWDGLFAQSEDTFRATDLDGINRIYGFANVAGTEWRVFSGVQYQLIHAEMVAHLQRSIGIAAAILLVAMITVYWLARIILLPMRRIEAAASEIASGRTDARASAGGPHEIATVAAQFNVMLDTLDASERRFRETLENVHLIAVALDVQGNVTYCNDFLLELSGWRREELLGRNWFETMLPDPLPVRARFDQAIRDENIPPHYENEIVTRQGERRLIHWNNTILRDPANRILGTVSLGEDITERKRADETVRGLLAETQRARNALLNLLEDQKRAGDALREKENLLSESQRIGHIGGWSWNLTGPIDWTDETYRVYGVSPESFTPTIESLVSLVHPDDRPAMQRWTEACAAGAKPAELVFRAISPDGSVRVLSGRGEMTYDAENKPAYMAGTVQDITERKLAEQKILDQLDELRRWQEVMLGREDRVMQIKAEVNELHARLGEPARYPSQGD